MDTFREIVETYSAMVFNHSLKLLGNREDAEEASQDVFMKIYRGIDQFRGDAKLSTWIWRITSNVCYTKLAKKNLPVETLDESHNSIEAPENFIGTLGDEEKQKAVLDAIARIPEQQANVLLLFYFDGLSYKEIADALAIPEGTVATILYRGRENVRLILEKQQKGKV